MAGSPVIRTSGSYCCTPPGTKYLWHLMDVRKLETFLRGGLWLARLDQFNDSREGSVPAHNIGLLSKLLSTQLPQVLEQYALGVQRAYASCWHMNDGDPSDYAWREFSNSTDGLAIRTKPDAMRAVLQHITGPDGPVHFGAVRYIDHSTDYIPDGNVLEAAFVVRSEYAQEQEARVLIHTHGTAAADRLVGQEGPDGPLVRSLSSAESPSGVREFTGGQNEGRAIVVRIDPAALIEEVVIDQRVSDRERQRIERLVTQCGLASRIRPA